MPPKIFRSEAEKRAFEARQQQQPRQQQQQQQQRRPGGGGGPAKKNGRAGGQGGTQPYRESDRAGSSAATAAASARAQAKNAAATAAASARAQAKNAAATASAAPAKPERKGGLPDNISVPTMLATARAVTASDEPAHPRKEDVAQLVAAYEKNWVTDDQCAELMVAMLFG